MCKIQRSHDRRRHHMLRRLLNLIAAASLLSGSHAFCADPSIPHAQKKPPGPALSPQDAMQKMELPAGFKVELVASEPDIANPTSMTFDERGRIWISESVEYPRAAAG